LLLRGSDADPGIAESVGVGTAQRYGQRVRRSTSTGAAAR